MEDRGAGVTSGIPCEVSYVDDDDSKFDDDDSKLLLTMLFSVACSAFSMFMFLVCFVTLVLAGGDFSLRY